MRILLALLVCLLVGGCARKFELEAFNGTFKVKFESRAAKSYRVLSYDNKTSGRSFDGLYFDSECELLLCAECGECCGLGCEGPPPINPETEDSE